MLKLLAASAEQLVQFIHLADSIRRANWFKKVTNFFTYWLQNDRKLLISYDGIKVAVANTQQPRDNMKKILSHSVAIASLALGLIGTAQASLVGSSVHGVMDAHGVLLDQTEVVGAATEFSYAANLSSFLNADIGDSTISLVYITGATTSIGDDLLWTFTLDPSLTFLSITEQSDDYINGASLVGFSGSTATFKVFNQVGNTQSLYSAVYSVVIADANTVPEPSSVALLGLGLAAVVVSRKRKQA